MSRGFGSEKDQEKLKKRLNALLRLPENKNCCECGQRQPQWASINLGVFFCIRCAGIHRNLGVHISAVRSATLDSWKSEWIDVLEEWGNARGNALWEAKNPGSRKPDEHASDYVLENFIRDKYVKGMWKGNPDAVTSAPAPAPAPAPTRQAAPAALSKPVAAPSKAAIATAAPTPAAPAVDPFAALDNFAQKDEDDFATFFDDASTTSAAPTAAAPKMSALDALFASGPAPTQPQQQQQFPQGQFPGQGNPNMGAAAPASNDPFAALSSKPSNPTKDIMSLYSQPQQPAQGGMQGMGMGMGMGMGQMTQQQMYMMQQQQMQQQMMMRGQMGMGMGMGMPQNNMSGMGMGAGMGMGGGMGMGMGMQQQPFPSAVATNANAFAAFSQPAQPQANTNPNDVFAGLF